MKGLISEREIALEEAAQVAEARKPLYAELQAKNACAEIASSIRSLPFRSAPEHATAVRELALEEAARAAENAMLEYNLSECAGLADWAAFEAGQESGLVHAAAAIRALSSPDHADAGKVEEDARADLERLWRPISEADKSITFEHTFDLGDGEKMTIRNSDHYWVRDADGRVYEATWSDHKGGYWWDLEGESPADPVEYMPHPLSLPSAPASEGAE
ncbi:hypothetical protein [Ochrobactrum sp. A-1]|uniref:hypothetical protein n=1 Tax=Ochrobactrum sp. A-1 TaxID=2920940 RepID=UPI001F0A5246|nr:hypothetical protein [Ochrobactrum sp. A-1]